jgi:pSer/pThr/pTyr-binding forkhead associated (FHA) protein
MMTTIMPPAQRTPQEEAGCVVVHYGGRTFTIAQQGNPFLVGRDSSCQLVVTTTMASRQHASIEWRRGKFILSDRSTNGTFVLPEGGRPIHLRREEFVLQGAGLLGFGEQPRAEGSGGVSYEYRASAAKQ